MMNRKNSFQLSPRLKIGVGRHLPKFSIIKIITGAFIVFSIGLGLNAYNLYTDVNDTENKTPEARVLGISDTKAASTANDQISITTYTVKKGDTLFSIAQQFNISWTTLATINAIQSPFTVNPGQELKVPKQ